MKKLLTLVLASLFIIGCNRTISQSSLNKAYTACEDKEGVYSLYDDRVNGRLYVNCKYGSKKLL